MIAAVSWALAVMVMFGPGATIAAIFWHRRRQHRALRARIRPYSHLGRAAR